MKLCFSYAFIMLQTIITMLAAVSAFNHPREFGLKCLLSVQTTSDCNRQDVIIPDRLSQLLVNLNKETMDKLETINLDTMTPDGIAELPPVLIYLLPVTHMEDMSGTGLAMLMQRNADNSALAVKIIDTLQTSAQQSQFFDKLIGTKLPPRTQQLLGTRMAVWYPNLTSDWTHDTFLKTVRNGSPLMAYLPPATVLELRGKQASKFLSRLRLWHVSTLNKWPNNLKTVKRVWASLAMRELFAKWPVDDVNGFEFLLVGATASEIRLLSPKQIGKMIFSKEIFDKSQVRALFKVLYGSDTLTAGNLTEVLPIVLQLTPSQLQQFNPNVTDFRLLKAVTPDRRHSSFATDKQVLECLIAQSVLGKRLPSNQPDTWLDAIQELHEFIYVLPISVLETYNNQSRLGAQVLLAIDSEKLSKKQAMILTNQGAAFNLQVPASVLGLRGLLKALPIWVIVKQRTGSLSQNVLSHIVTSLPDYEPAMSAAVLHKVRPQLGESSVLEALLSNKQFGQYFNLLSSREVHSFSKEISQSLKKLNMGFQKRIKSLPPNILSVLLMSSIKQSALNWTSDELIENAAFLGLSCRVIHQLDVVDAMTVLGNYSLELSATGQHFPKSLQYCGQQLVVRYAALKFYLRQSSNQDNVLDVIEPAEIHAIGGYILSSFPPELIRSAKYKKDILKVIAQQPLPQLLEAVGSIGNLEKYAAYLLVDLLDRTRTVGINELQSLGSLKYFISTTDIKRIEPKAFKFYIESTDDKRGKTVCGNLEKRQEWFKLIQNTFGPPNQWDVGTLGLLGDWLLAVPTDSLDLIHASKWSEAVDVLVEQTSYHKKLSWLGFEHPISFKEVCLDILSTYERHAYMNSVNALLRKYLYAGQSQLDSIVTADKLLSSIRMFEHKEHQVRTIPGLQIQRSATKIEVLEAKELGESNEVAGTKIIVATSLPNIISTELPEGITMVTDLEKSETMTAATVPEEAATEALPSVTDSNTDSTESNTDSTESNTDSTESIATLTEITASKTTIFAPSGREVNYVGDGSGDGMHDNEITTLLFTEESIATSIPETATTTSFTTAAGNNPESVTTTIDKTIVVDASTTAVDIPRGGDRRRRDVEDNQVINGNEKKISTEPTRQTVKNDNDNRTNKKLSCDAIRALGSSASLALEWRDIELWSPLEMEDCLEVLGSLDLPKEMYKKIWSLVDKDKLLSNLASLGHIVQAIEHQDIKTLNLSLGIDTSLDTLAVLGRYVNIDGNNGRMMEAIASRLHYNNPDMSYNGPAPVIALGAIACYLPLDTLRVLVDTSFLHVSSALGHMKGCPRMCLDMFIQLAEESQAFGTPDSWTAEDLTTMGTIPAGLSGQQWQLVQPDELEGLKPIAVKCIPPHVFKDLSVVQLSRLSPVAASIVSEPQMAALSTDQKKALRSVRNLELITVNYRDGRSTSSDASTLAIKMNKCRSLFFRYMINVAFISTLVSIASMFYM